LQFFTVSLVSRIEVFHLSGSRNATFVIATVSTTGRPFPSNHPHPELPATSSIVFDQVPEPRRVQQLLEFIGAREDIHPSRLWFTSLRGNEKQKLAPSSGPLRGLPLTAEVPVAPDATSAVIITVYLTRPFRREMARSSPPALFLALRAILNMRRRLEQSPVFGKADAIAGCIAVICCMTLHGAMTMAALGDKRLLYIAPDGTQYYG
jgi:hypothetical protein